jgi:hypothetical protein
MEDVAEQLGMDLENAIREKILSNIPPPNAPGTIKAKGSSHTLIDQGTLLDSIEHTTEIGPELIIITTGVFQEDVAEYACYNEYGTEHIPERSFVRSTFDEIFDTQLMEDFSDNMQKLTNDKLSRTK